MERAPHPGAPGSRSWLAQVREDPGAVAVRAWPRIRLPLVIVLVVAELALAYVLVAINSFTPINADPLDVVQSGVSPAALVSTFGTVALGVIAGVSLLWVRRWPFIVLVAVAALSALTGLWVAASVALIVVAARSRPGLVAAGAVVYLAGRELGVRAPYGDALSHALTLHEAAWFVWLLIDMTAMVAFVALGLLARLVGDVTRAEERSRARAEYERQLMVDAVRASERNRVAREMHDVVAHRVSLIALHAGSLELQAKDATVTESARIIRDAAKAALDELRDALAVLREDGGGDELAPQPNLSDLPALVEESHRAGIRVDYVSLLDEAVPEQLGRAAHRIVQEALTNVHKHAPSSDVAITVSGRPGGSLHVRVVNGLGEAVGGSEENSSLGSGRGLVGIAERISVLGGQVAYGVTPEREWAIDADLPWPAQDDSAAAPLIAGRTV